MDDRILDRLALVTLFANRGIEYYVSVYADVQARLPGISYDRPIGQVGEAIVVIKPFREANDEEIAALG